MFDEKIATKEEVIVYKKAKSILQRSPILFNQSSSCRNAWCEGF